MTPLVLSHPLPALPAVPWLRPLLRLLAGSRPVLPEDLEDWQLRDLGITRPNTAFRPGPDHTLHHWLP